jgi:hypothetical protein
MDAACGPGEQAAKHWPADNLPGTMIFFFRSWSMRTLMDHGAVPLVTQDDAL